MNTGCLQVATRELASETLQTEERLNFEQFFFSAKSVARILKDPPKYDLNLHCGTVGVRHLTP